MYNSVEHATNNFTLYALLKIITYPSSKTFKRSTFLHFYTVG